MQQAHQVAQSAGLATLCQHRHLLPIECQFFLGVQSQDRLDSTHGDETMWISGGLGVVEDHW